MKQFCEEKNFKVFAIHGRRGIKVGKDYEEAIRIYVEKKDLKFKAGNIMKKYEI